MSERAEVLCCSRPMTRIAVTTSGSELTLRTCAGCGRHGWQARGRPVDRDGLLEVVRSTPRRRSRRAPATPS